MKNIKYRLKTDIAVFEIKKEPLGLWDLWINSMPTLTFQSPDRLHHLPCRRSLTFATSSAMT